MPYFKRLPYAETLLRDRAPEPDSVATPDAKAEPFLGLANSVLAGEAGAGALVEGPFSVQSPVRPGDIGRMVLSLENTGSGGPLALQVTPSGLQSSGGGTIDAAQVTITPAHLTVPAGGAGDIEVAIKVPPDAKPDTYTGSVAVSGPRPFAIQITIDVQ
jgi:hypothetical protein